MVIASEARILGNSSGPKFLDDEMGRILEHTGLDDGRNKYGMFNANRERYSLTWDDLETYTLADAIRAQAIVMESAEAGGIFDYWILDAGIRVGNAQLWVPSQGAKPELSFLLVEGREGKGLATRGVRTLLEYAFSRPNVSEATAWIKPDNTASQQVAKNVGAVIWGRGMREWRGGLAPVDIWGVSKDA